MWTESHVVLVFLTCHIQSLQPLVEHCVHAVRHHHHHHHVRHPNLGTLFCTALRSGAGHCVRTR